jgi:uncharacterized protein
LIATPFPPPPPPLAPGASRIGVVDALRGFALLGIVIAHMSEQYLGGPPPPSRPDFGIFSPVDQVAMALWGTLIVGKFFLMFSLLFGVSFFIQMDRAAARGVAFERRFLWRLALLFAMGMLHHLLYRGDILAIFALLGVPLVAFYRASDRVLLVTAALLALGVPRLLLAGGTWLLGHDLALMPPGEAMEPYFAAVEAGALGQIAWLNLSEGFLTKLDFQFGLFGRGYQTMALFLMGLYLARARWHETIADRRPQLRRALWGGLGLMAASMALLAVTIALLGMPESPEAITRAHLVVGLTLYDQINLGMATALVSGFLLLYHRPAAHGILRHLTPAGQTALTVYLTQTLIGTFLLYGHGLGWIGRIGTATAMLLAVCIFGLQMAIAALWLRRFRYGPIEWAWRSATFGRLAPLRLAHPVSLPAAQTEAARAPQ